MADVRSMLRQQRASRQQSGRPQKQSAAPAAAPVSKKRKAATDDGIEERKRTRTEEATGVPAGFFDGGAAADEQATPGTEDEPALDTTPDAPMAAEPPPPPPLDAAAQAELDAFIKEMHEPPPPQNGLSGFPAGVVIEAAPMTAAELAAQAREDLSAQRAKRDEEMEGEKEDAARALEDEFDEMEGLEERVKKLREQREALRMTRAPNQTENVALADPQPVIEESDSEDEDWDDWKFGPA
ncbi:hypothetical protein BDV95DRAFT_575236 [Massariosphaeria phaeospora]|uniref:Uncharacterized protein n=1 Tax=Massariosphaeria phaeospora TaxID=100035 RepID=A0A7C8M6H3_9PLEO|nr:hypothetical protein BDV95DRAFT_575236 [Massariosphaeria phaeospora]